MDSSVPFVGRGSPHQHPNVRFGSQHPSWPRFINLGNRPSISLILVVVAIPVLAQLALGANVVVLALVAAASLTGLMTLRLMGSYNIAGWLSALFVLGNALIAIYAKTLFGQAVDSYLYAPLDSFFVLAIGTAELLIATLLVYYLPVGKAIFRPVRNVKFLSFISLATFLLGTVFWCLNLMYEGIDRLGWGFRPLFLFR